eukprot:5784958-Pyramimonas_sp.AAC.1
MRGLASRPLALKGVLGAAAARSAAGGIHERNTALGEKAHVRGEQRWRSWLNDRGSTASGAPESGGLSRRSDSPRGQSRGPLLLPLLLLLV